MVHTLPVPSRIEDTSNNLKVSYNDALKHLKALVNLIFNYEELSKKSNLNATIQDLQRSVRLAHDSVKKVDQITSFHTEFFKVQLILLTRDIALKENQLRNYTAEQDRLMVERTRWQDQIQDIRQEQSALDTKISTGLDDRQTYSETQQLLQSAENKLRNVFARNMAVQRSVVNTKKNISTVQSKLNQSRVTYILLRDLGVQMRNIFNFLTQFSEKLNVIPDQELLVLLRPLGELTRLLSRRQPFNG